MFCNGDGKNEFSCEIIDEYEFCSKWVFSAWNALIYSNVFLNKTPTTGNAMAIDAVTAYGSNIVAELRTKSQLKILMKFSVLAQG